MLYSIFQLFLALATERARQRPTSVAKRTYPTKIMDLTRYCLLKAIRALWKVADSKTEAENIQDEPQFVMQKPREKMNIEMCIGTQMPTEEASTFSKDGSIWTSVRIITAGS